MLSPLTALMLVLVGGIPVRTVTWAYAAFVMGTLLELSRLTNSPKNAAWISLAAFGLSLFNFLPYKRETNYSLASHLDSWPIVFVMVLLLVMVVAYSKRLTVRLGEGNTLLYSIAFFYWMFDRYTHQSGGILPVVVAALPLAYAVTHAFTDLPLSRGVRLVLSLWSGVVMAALAVRYVTTVMQLGSIEDRLAAAEIEAAALIFAEFLLLGAAGATIGQNLMMLLDYVPDRRHFFDKQYFKRTRELSRAHVERFSAEQLPRGQALAATVFASLLLVANWNLQMVSTGFVIWFLVAGVPWIIGAWLWWGAMRRRERGPVGEPADRRAIDDASPRG